MCGGTIGNFWKNELEPYTFWGEKNPFAIIGGVAEDIYAGFGVDTSGLDYRTTDLTREAHGQPTQAEMEKAAAEARERAMKLALGKAQGPEKSALSVDVAREVRDRRRRAALYGISQLTVPGSGSASGGSGVGYGGANAPLY